MLTKKSLILSICIGFGFLSNSVSAITVSTTDSAGLRSFDGGTTIIPLTFTRAFGGTEDRGIEHFDISGISAPVSSATLDIEVYSLDPNGQLDIYHFAGDGAVSIDEWDVGTLAFSQTGIAESSYIPLSFNITSILQAYLTAGESFLSFNYRGPGSRVDFGLTSGIGTEASVLNVSTVPQVVPVPAAVWLFGSALIGLVGYTRRRQSA